MASARVPLNATIKQAHENVYSENRVCIQENYIRSLYGCARMITMMNMNKKRDKSGIDRDGGDDGDEWALKKCSVHKKNRGARMKL